jgi:molybdate transport system substrate-binding protein
MVFQRIREGALVRALLFGWASSALGLLVVSCEGRSTDDREASSHEASSQVEACSTRTIRMAVASSLREMAVGLVRDFEARDPAIRIEATFGASSAIARQLRFGAPIDLLALADEQIVDSLRERQLIDAESLREIARGRLVLVARTGSPFDSLGVEALRSPELERLALPGVAVPLGRYGRSWLARHALLDPLEGRIVVTENARASLAALSQGHVDLALLYETDSRLDPDLITIHRPQLDEYPEIRYLAARATQAPSCPQIDHVLDGWQTRETRARFEAAGFELPERALETRSASSGSEGP